MIVRKSLYFAHPYQVELRQESLPPLGANELLVQTTLTAISAGTELLFYRGQVPSGMSVDASFSGMDGDVTYPLAYGYCAVGRVEDVGPQVDQAWRGRRVFSFQPHTSAFVCDAMSLLPIPDHITDEQAVLLPNMESAVNFIMDARPLVGERILLMGLGVVGLLTLYILKQFPLESLHAIDGYAKRRQIATAWGLSNVFSPGDSGQLGELNPDLIIEVSSAPAALTAAIELAGFGTRIVIASWYGDKIAHLPLGGHFHRNRIQIVSTQVSTIDGQFNNRWNKPRRIQFAWTQLAKLPVGDLITHKMPIYSAAEAYQMLDKTPEEAVQVLFTYPQP